MSDKPVKAPAIPVVLFAYARPDHLRRTLACLRENNIPILYVFADGAKTPEMIERVNEVRQILREINWCEVHLVERAQNFGLGKNILSGVGEVFQKHETIIVFEEDLNCVPGTYQYLCAALEHYRDNPRVMSVTGWTHPLITPQDITDQPYFDGRSECWAWGTWARVWRDLPMDPVRLVTECKRKGIDIYRYGADLVGYVQRDPHMAVSWDMPMFFYHIFHGGLCLRPPWSMVEHIGFDAEATNTKTDSWLKNPPLKPSPSIPAQWPKPVENPGCQRLYQKVYGGRPTIPDRLYRFARRVASKMLHSVSPG